MHGCHIDIRSLRGRTSLDMSTVANAVIDRRVEVIDGANTDRGAIQRVSDLRALPFVVLLRQQFSSDARTN